MDEVQIQRIVELVSAALEPKFEAMDKKFEARFEAMDKKFEARFEAIDERFKGVEENITAMTASIANLQARTPQTNNDDNATAIGIYETVWPFRRFWVPLCPKSWIKAD